MSHDQGETNRTPSGSRLAWLLAGVATTMIGGSALAQQAPVATANPPAPAPRGAPTEQDYEVETLIVEAARQPGAVIGDIPAEMQFKPADIQAYGVSTVAELITALSPQTTSGQGRDAGGRPVILINGARTSSFSEIRDLPTEAILRVDILPEEVALKYGYTAEQRVINMVLRPRFRATTVEGGYKTSFKAGGGDTADIHATEVRIEQQNRLLLDVKANGQNRLLESDRYFAQPRADSAFRTLSPDQSSLGFNGVYSRPLGNGVAGSVNTSLDSNNSTALLGVDPSLPRALIRHNKSLSGHLGLAAAGALKGWRWTATGNADRSNSDSSTQRVIGGVNFNDLSNSVATTGDGELVLNGNLFAVPAGKATTTITGGVAASKFDSNFLRAGIAGSGSLSRNTGTAKINLDVPLASVRSGVLAAIGDLSLNLNAAVNDLSDFGALRTVGAGLSWGPITNMRILASVSDDQGAPSVQQLGNPVQVTPGVQSYDFRTGQTATISEVTGGNAKLRADDRRVFKLGMNYKPFSKADLNLTINYVYTQTEDLISSFPTGSTQIENAFPDRFIRNTSGALTQIDARPVNFDHRDTQELRYGFTFRRPFGPQPVARPAGGFPTGQRGPGQGAGQGQRGQFGGQGPRAPQDQGQTQPAGRGPGQNGDAPRQNGVGGPPPQGAPFPGGPPPGGGFGGPPGGGFGGGGPGGPPGGGGFGGPPGGFGGGGGPGGGGFGGRGGGGGNLGGQFQIGLYHTVRFQDEVRVRPGLPVLDLLNGGSLGAGAGTARNQLDLQANLSQAGLGLAMNARWKEGSVIRSTALAGSQDLFFSDTTTINLRLFADLPSQPFFKRHPFFRGSRATLAIDNLFDQIQNVRDASGATPIVYQPNYLDPQGRTLRFSFRKLF